MAPPARIGKYAGGAKPVARPRPTLRGKGKSVTRKPSALFTPGRGLINR